MEALNIRLEEMPSLKTAQGLKNTSQAESSFSMVLDRALNDMDCLQSNDYNTSFETARMDAKRLEDAKSQNSAVQKSIDERALADKRANEKIANDKASELNANAKLEESRRNAKASEEKSADKARENAKNAENDASKNATNVNDAKESTSKVADDAEKTLTKKLAKEEASNLEEASKLALLDLEKVDTKDALKEEDATTAEILMANAFVAKNLSADNSNAENLQNANVQNVQDKDALQDVSATSKKTTKKTDALLANILSPKSQDTSTVVEDANTNDANIALNARKNAKTANTEPVFTVIDERTMAEDAKNSKNNFVTTVQYDGANTAEMNMHLPQSSVQSSLTAKASVDTVQMGQNANFSTMLSSEIKNNASDFVKTGLITLKDNNQGTINLILHPEELGNVKIKLELSDSIITGRIIVQTEEAFGAFKDNIESLRQAFVSQGFEAAGFELSYQGGDASSNNHEGTSNGHNAKGIVYSDGIPSASSEEMSYNAYFSTAQVNVVV